MDEAICMPSQSRAGFAQAQESTQRYANASWFHSDQIELTLFDEHFGGVRCSIFGKAKN
jgi:hypothetical protein